MYWQEKIDILKKKFPQTDFRNPFMDWPKILKKMEAKFIIKENTNFHFTNWAGRLKNKVLVKTIIHQSIYQEIKKLSPDTNYWVVIVYGDYPTSKHLVYDCKLNSLEALLGFTIGDFYIIDKKYNWLSYFKIDREKGKVSLFKTANSMTPFEN